MTLGADQADKGRHANPDSRRENRVCGEGRMDDGDEAGRRVSSRMGVMKILLGLFEAVQWSAGAACFAGGRVSVRPL